MRKSGNIEVMIDAKLSIREFHSIYVKRQLVPLRYLPNVGEPKLYALCITCVGGSTCKDPEAKGTSAEAKKKTNAKGMGSTQKAGVRREDV